MTNDGELRILSRDMTEAVRMAAERDRERELADTLGRALERCPCMIPGASCIWLFENGRTHGDGMCPRCAALRQWREARKG